MRIISMSSEQAPWSKSGGLADVTSALPQALSQVRPHFSILTLSPLYPCVWKEVARQGLQLQEGPSISLQPLSDEKATLWLLTSNDATETSNHILTAFIEIAVYFDRPYLYGPPGSSYEDEPLRYALFSLAALRFSSIKTSLSDWFTGTPPAFIHLHDWQVSYAFFYMEREFRTDHSSIQPKTLFTIHNMAYQGKCDKSWLPKLQIEWDCFHYNDSEFFDTFNPLKGALIRADVVSTVSPQYADELQSYQFACGLDGFIHHHELSFQGIINGLDTQLWDPTTSSYLSKHLPKSDPSLDQIEQWKIHCRHDIQEQLNLPQGPAILAVIARLDYQKGLDLIIQAAPLIVHHGLQLVVLGSGDPYLASQFKDLMHEYPQSVHCHIGFDVALAHQLFAASDITLIPSRFEPCGLTQMQAMRYASIPVASAVGGLVNTIQQDCEETTGYLFSPVASGPFQQALQQAILDLQQQDDWQMMRKRALNQDWHWLHSAKKWALLMENQPL